jgi:hypothetical protein
MLGSLDTLILAPFLLPADPLVGYWLGCGTLALLSVALGELTTTIWRHFNQRQLATLGREALTRQAESIAALQQGDQEAYEAANKLANEAHGRWFFQGAAGGIAALWPAFFAAAWLDQRFSLVAFPIPFTHATASFVTPLIIWLVVLRLGLAVVQRYVRHANAIGA